MLSIKKNRMSKTSLNVSISRGCEKVGAFVRYFNAERSIQFVYERFNSFENVGMVHI